MLAKGSALLCLAAAIATLLLVIPGAYCEVATLPEASFVVVLVGPYLLLALLAWSRRHNPRDSRTLLVLNLLVAVVGLAVFMAETSSYHAAIADFASRNPDRSVEYFRERFPRTALFAIPALQWLVSLTAAVALLIQTRFSRS